jgi:hypothetical protein
MVSWKREPLILLISLLPMPFGWHNLRRSLLIHSFPRVRPLSLDSTLNLAASAVPSRKRIRVTESTARLWSESALDGVQGRSYIQVR